MLAGKRLNYVISKDVDDGLNKYSEQTGRSASDVIRQLLSEFINGERELAGPPKDATDGIRSNMLLPDKLLDHLDKKIELEKLGTRGGVISRLLHDFLENRLGTLFNETVTITLDKTTFNRLYQQSNELGIKVEEYIVNICKQQNKKKVQS